MCTHVAYKKKTLAWHSWNVKLTQSLNKLSEQFVLEQVKNQKLSTQLAEQEKDMMELEEQLDKILEDAADKKLNLEGLTSWNEKDKTYSVFHSYCSDFIVVHLRMQQNSKGEIIKSGRNCWQFRSYQEF